MQGVMVYAFSSSTQEQRQADHYEFQDSQGDIMRPCLKQQQKVSFIMKSRDDSSRILLKGSKIPHSLTVECVYTCS